MALKIGTEDKKKVAIAGTLGALVLFLVVRMAVQTFGSGDAPAPVPATHAVAPARTTTRDMGATAAGNSQQSYPGVHTATRVGGITLDPTLHPEVMASAESLIYTGRGRNIFSMSSMPIDLPTPLASARPNRMALAAGIPSGPPPPPPIDLKFFGFQSTANGVRKAFLIHGDDIFFAAEGDVVNRRYKVGAISANSLQITDLAYNNTQTLRLQMN